MPIEFRCTACGKLLRTPDQTHGQQAKCPACGAGVTVPEAGQSSPPGTAPGRREPFGGASDYGYGQPDSLNPYQSPGEIPPETTPFGPGFQPTGVRPTRIDFGEVFSQTWKVFTQRWAMCLGVALVCFVINFIVGQIGGTALQLLAMAGAGGLLVGIVIYVAALIFQAWISAGEKMFFINTARGRTADFANVFAGGPYLLRIIAGGVLIGLGMCVIAGICFLPAGVLALAREQDAAAAASLVGMIVAVIGVTIVWFIYFPYSYLIIDQNMGIIESLSEARRVTAGNRLTAFAIMLIAGIACGLLILCTCGVGLLAALPYMPLLMAVMYVMMIGQPTAGGQVQPANEAALPPGGVS